MPAGIAEFSCAQGIVQQVENPLGEPRAVGGWDDKAGFVMANIALAMRDDELKSKIGEYLDGFRRG